MNEWKIYRTWEFLLPFVARLGERSVNLGHDPQVEHRRIEELSWAYQADGLMCRVTMTIDGKLFEFAMKAEGSKIIPPILTMKPSTSGITVTIPNVGTATYRDAWRDSDKQEKIVGFVDCDCPESANEEALVWFVGTWMHPGLERSLIG
jgi:hypothetical protein